MDGLLNGNGFIDPYSLTLASEVVFRVWDRVQNTWLENQKNV